MTPFDELVIQSVIPRVQAWERLHDRNYSRQLRMDEFYDLLIEAGYSENTAQIAATKRGNDRLDLGAEV